MDKKPTCWDCQLSSKFSGTCGSMYEPPTDPEVHCNCSGVNEELGEENEWDEEVMPGICGHFTPQAKQEENFSERYNRWIDDLDRRYSVLELWKMGRSAGLMGE